MEVVEFPHLPPSICFICRNTTGPLVDTGLTFDPPGITELNGRKYLCESCVRTAADALGILEERANPFAEALAAAEEKIEELVRELADRLSLEEIAARLAPKPAKKAPKKAEE